MTNFILQTGGIISEFLSRFNIPFSDSIGALISFIIVFLIIYLIGRIILLSILDKILEKKGLDRHAKVPLRKLTFGIIIFIGIAVSFEFAGYGNFLTSLATIAAAATLAIGFATQDVIKNFVAGIFIFTDRPFKIGDWIEWDEYSGIVEDISLRVSRVRTFDNELLTVPNSQLTNGVIKNPVAKDKLRIKFVFGIGYEDEIKKATNILIEEAKKHSEILEEPEPSVRLTELADSYIGLQSRVWIKDPQRSDFIRIRGEYIKNVKERFDGEGIEIPFPQRELSGNINIDQLEKFDEKRT